MRGFIDDSSALLRDKLMKESQSAFMRGFIDDEAIHLVQDLAQPESQSAFMRGFIDDAASAAPSTATSAVSIRVHARLHR